MRALPFLALALLVPVAACRSRGEYTEAARAEAEAGLAGLRSSTQFDQAYQLYRTGDLETALEKIDTSLALNDGVAKSHLLRGRVLIELGRLPEALDSLATGAALEPADSRFPYYRGFAFEQLGLKEEALGAYLEAAELEGELAQNRLAAVELLIDLGRPDEARVLLEDDTGVLGAHAGFRQALGHLQLLEGDLEGASRSFSEASILGPEDPALLEDLSRVQVASGKYAQAEATLRRLRKDEAYADRTDLKRLHARCLLQLNRPVEARKLLMELTGAPNGAHDVEAWNGLVDVALMLHDDRLLRSAADRLLATAPESAAGYLALAMWQRRTGDVEGALRSTRIAKQRAGEDPIPGKLEALLVRQLEEQESQTSSSGS